MVKSAITHLKWQKMIWKFGKIISCTTPSYGWCEIWFSFKADFTWKPGYALCCFIRQDRNNNGNTLLLGNFSFRFCKTPALKVVPRSFWNLINLVRSSRMAEFLLSSFPPCTLLKINLGIHESQLTSSKFMQPTEVSTLWITGSFPHSWINITFKMARLIFLFVIFQSYITSVDSIFYHSVSLK